MTVPYSFAHNAFAAALQSSYDHLADGEESGDSVNVAGRLMLLRRQGKLAFATMRDSSGEIQLFALESVTVGLRGVHETAPGRLGGRER